MTRLIDADELLEELRKSCKYHAENSRELSLLQRDINIVKEQPTVDAVPARHGKWIRTGRTNIYGGYELECPVCGDRVMVQNIEYELYCRNCGARMDERKEE